MNLLDLWKLDELRIAVIGDLADFIPQNYYESIPNNDSMRRSVMDCKLYKLILNDQNKNPQKYSPRQVAASNVFKFIALYIATNGFLLQSPKLPPQEVWPPEQQAEYEAIKSELYRLYSFLFSCCNDLFIDLDNWLLYLPENEAKPFRSDNLKWSKDIGKKHLQAFVEKFGFIPECEQELYKANRQESLLSNVQTQNAAIDIPVSKQSKTQDDSWKKIARERADIIYEKQKNVGCDPSKLTIANMIAKEFEKEGIQTLKGKRLNGGYIVRHGLNKWNRPKK